MYKLVNKFIEGYSLKSYQISYNPMKSICQA